MFNIYSIEIKEENGTNSISFLVGWYFVLNDIGSITGIKEFNNIEKEEFIINDKFKIDAVLNKIKQSFSNEEIELIKEKIQNNHNKNKQNIILNDNSIQRTTTEYPKRSTNRDAVSFISSVD